MKRIIITLAIVSLVMSCSALKLGKDLSSIKIPEETETTPAFELVFPEEPLTEEETEAYIENFTSRNAIIPEEEITPIPIEEAVELVFDASEPIPEPVETPVAEGSNVHHMPEPSSEVHLGNTVLPMWFVYSAMALCLACLFTICYISKQRKEAYWRRMRD